jgi:hypothetical protein
MMQIKVPAVPLRLPRVVIIAAQWDKKQKLSRRLLPNLVGNLSESESPYTFTFWV